MQMRFSNLIKKNARPGLIKKKALYDKESIKLLLDIIFEAAEDNWLITNYRVVPLIKSGVLDISEIKEHIKSLLNATFKIADEDKDLVSHVIPALIKS